MNNNFDAPHHEIFVHISCFLFLQPKYFFSQTFSSCEIFQVPIVVPIEWNEGSAIQLNDKLSSARYLVVLGMNILSSFSRYFLALNIQTLCSSEKSVTVPIYTASKTVRRKSSETLFWNLKSHHYVPLLKTKVLTRILGLKYNRCVIWSSEKFWEWNGNNETGCQSNRLVSV